MVVERKLASEGQSRKELGRAAFEKKVWEWQEEYGGSILEQLQRLGASCDWSREKFTLEPAMSRERMINASYYNGSWHNKAQRFGRLLKGRITFWYSPGWDRTSDLKINSLAL